MGLIPSAPIALLFRLKHSLDTLHILSTFLLIPFTATYRTRRALWTVIKAAPSTRDLFSNRYLSIQDNAISGP